MLRFFILATLVCLTLGAVCALYVRGAQVSSTKHAATPDITKPELEKAIADKQVVLIDCNGSDSFAEGHIPSAIDFSKHDTGLAALLPTQRDALIVAYCGGPACGAYKAATDAASDLGYTNVKHYSGGISGWKKDGGAVEQH